MRPEIVFVGGVWSLGLAFTNVHQYWTRGMQFCELSSQEQTEISDSALMAIAAVSVAYLLIFNAMNFGKCNLIVIKGYSWFINAIIVGTTVVYHFPVCILVIVFMFPLLHFSVGIFGFNSHKLDIKQKITGLIGFAASLATGVVFLFGSVMFEPGFNFKTDMLHVAMRDTFCAGSNLYVYLCAIFVPNALTII